MGESRRAGKSHEKPDSAGGTMPRERCGASLKVKFTKGDGFTAAPFKAISRAKYALVGHYKVIIVQQAPLRCSEPWIGGAAF